MSVYQATARNFSSETENRIHSDDVAARFGFAGALVPGAAVFGHMTRPLVDTLGSDWLTNWTADVRFIKPAYHGDTLTIRHEAADGEHTVWCHARGVLLAELTSTADEPTESEPTAIGAGAAIDERPEIHWDNVAVGEAFPAWTWSPDAIANAESAAQVEDDLDCYRHGVVHPQCDPRHGQPRLHASLSPAGLDPRRIDGEIPQAVAGGRRDRSTHRADP